MDELYYQACDKVEDIQKDIEEVDNYIDTLKKLKNSKFSPEDEVKTLNTIENILEEKRENLQNKWAIAYNSLAIEADFIVEAFNCNIDD